MVLFRICLYRVVFETELDSTMDCCLKIVVVVEIVVVVVVVVAAAGRLKITTLTIDQNSSNKNDKSKNDDHSNSYNTDKKSNCNKKISIHYTCDLWDGTRVSG